MRDNLRKGSEVPKAQITVTTTSIMNLNLDQTMTGELMHEGNTQIFSIDDSLVSNKTGYMMIEFA